MPKIRRRLSRKKCPFDEMGTDPYYRDVDTLSRFISERKRIFPAIYTSVCSKHQRKLSKAIKHARHMALLPFISEV